MRSLVAAIGTGHAACPARIGQKPSRVTYPSTTSSPYLICCCSSFVVMSGIVRDVDEAKSTHAYGQRTTLRYSGSPVMEEEKEWSNDSFHTKRMGGLYSSSSSSFFSPLSTADATRRTSDRARGHGHVRLYSIDVCIQKASKEQKMKSLLRHRRWRKRAGEREREERRRRRRRRRKKENIARWSLSAVGNEDGHAER